MKAFEMDGKCLWMASEWQIVILIRLLQRVMIQKEWNDEGMFLSAFDKRDNFGWKENPERKKNDWFIEK